MYDNVDICIFFFLFIVKQVVKVGQISEYVRQQVEEIGGGNTVSQVLLQDYNVISGVVNLRIFRIFV